MHSNDLCKLVQATFPITIMTVPTTTFSLNSAFIFLYFSVNTLLVNSGGARIFRLPGNSQGFRI